MLYCNNCGKQGHLYHDCKIPITSIGIILFQKNTNNELKYLMIRRKESFGICDFYRCKYQINNIPFIQNIIDEMTLSEKEILINNLINNNFNENQLKKFINLKSIFKDNYNINLDLIDLLQQSKTIFTEPEWGFPKGRRNNQEKDLDCALREFNEETGIAINDIVLLENVIPYEEIFIGSNLKSYKHKYYLAYSNKKLNLDNYQQSEVSKIEFKTLNECLTCMRPYNLEKKQVLLNINKALQDLRLYV
jgi:8-oxo-dGTP pyrophosphatase MutT (NUDIX family)